MDMKRMMMLLQKHQDLKNKLDAVEAEIAYFAKNGAIKRRVRIPGFQGEVLAFFKKHKNKSIQVKDIFKEMGLEKNQYYTLTSALHALYKKNLISPTRRGVYKLVK